MNLYLSAGGGLSSDSPSSDAHDEYVSDPARPVPYYPRPITADSWAEWQIADQRFVDGRPDVLTYETEPLGSDITLAGDPVANLFAATSGSDSDWVVKLIDVFPETEPDARLKGYELMIAGEVMRGRYAQSFEKPGPLVPGKVTAYAVHLRDRDHTFKAGHRIMVQIQSSWFPLIDRNPQRYVPSIYAAGEADFRPATQTVYRSARYPSHLTLPVATRPAEPWTPQ
jgi:putative CocE/NonD family hydrolase